MIFKISNKTFYKRHSAEVSRYTVNKSTLHIINQKSKNKVIDLGVEKLFIDIENKNPLELTSNYDVVILTDIVESHPNIFELFSQISNNLKIDGKLVISTFNSKYKFLIRFLELLNLKDKTKKYSFIHNKKIKNIVSGLGFQEVSHYSRQIFPFKLFGLGTYLNLTLEAVFKFANLGVKTYSIYRVQKAKFENSKKTIIIPAKNEEGNLRPLIKRIPRDSNYQILIPCGYSEDETFSVANSIMKEENFFEVETFMQSGTGKANAVWDSLNLASGDFIAILDADISVEPETIPKFFEIIENNHADFVNGTRLIYQMEKGSMRRINHFGNRAFQYLVGKIINEPLSDSLCGTKVFKKELIEDLAFWQSETKTKDPFGDFDLIFTAAYTGKKIIEYPIHYHARQYGSTQISRFRDGFKLIKYLFNSYFLFNTSRH
jgi:hypothetical protein